MPSDSISQPLPVGGIDSLRPVLLGTRHMAVAGHYGAAHAAFVSGWLFAFIVSFGELNTALFLTGPGLTTLPIEIFSYLQFQGSQLVIAAASTLQIALIVVMVTAVERIVGMGRIIRAR